MGARQTLDDQGLVDEFDRDLQHAVPADGDQGAFPDQLVHFGDHHTQRFGDLRHRDVVR